MKNLPIRMEHRILSLIMAAAMLLSAVPVTVFAEVSPDDRAYATSGVTVSGAEDEDDAPDDAYATSGVTDPEEDAAQPQEPATNGVTAALGIMPFAETTTCPTCALLGITQSATLITSQEELLKIGIDAAYPLSGCYILKNNITWDGIAASPIGGTFTGHFDGYWGGSKHTITDMKIAKSGQYSGLFARTSGATIKNLGLINPTVTATSSDVGAIMGNDMGGTLVSCCFVEGGSISGNAGVGGITGSTWALIYGDPNRQGLISNCYIRGTSISDAAGYGDCAGISGWNENTSRLEYVYLASNVTTPGSYKRPLAGYSDGSAVKGNTFLSCYYDKDVFGSADSAYTGFGRGTAEMKTQSTFLDWDFDTLWDIDAGINGGYPYLQGYDNFSASAAATGSISSVTASWSEDGYLIVNVTGSGNKNCRVQIISNPENASSLNGQDGTSVTSVNCSTADTQIPITGSGSVTVRITAQADSSKYVDVSIADLSEADDTPTYGISLNQTGTYTFTGASYGYGAQTACSVTVTNTGNQATGALTAELSGTNGSSFTLSAGTIGSIAESGSDSFTVTPDTGLAAGTYTATVTVSGGNDISKSFDISFTVSKATPSYTVPSGLTAVYGQTLADISLTGGSGAGTFAWASTATAVGNVGARQHTATFIPTDTANYSMVTGILVDVTVSPRNLSNVSIDEIAAQSYTGSAIEPTPSVRDSGAAITANDYDVAYSGNTDIGTATVTLTGKNNYTGTKTASFAIVTAALDGTPTVSGTVRIGETLTADISGLNTADGLSYQWKADGVTVGTNSTYSIQGSDVGKTITVTVTASGNCTGSVSASAAVAVPYTVIVEASGSDGDSVTAQTVYKNANETVTISYTLADTHLDNKLVLRAGSHVIATITTDDASTVNYTVTAAHATGGVILITAAFSHSSTLTTIGENTVAAPVNGEPPQTSVDDTHFTGTVIWDGDRTPNGKFAGGTEYTATVTLTAKDGVAFDENFMPAISGGDVTHVEVSGDGKTVTYTVVYDATPAKAVDSISVTANPAETTYYAGDTLDVTGLVITATYDDGTTATVTPDSYTIGGTAFTPGTTALTTAQNGAPIVISYGGKTAPTAALTVYSRLSAQIAVTSIGKDAATLTYSASGGSNDLTIQLQASINGVWTDVAGAAPSHALSALSPSTSYTYRCWVQDNETGRTQTKSVTFQTSAAAQTGITVEGDVIDSPNLPQVLVTLEHGNTVIASAEATAPPSSDTYHFTFTNVPDGIYNLVVDNGEWKVTQAVTIVNGVMTHPDSIVINMASGRTQSVVEIVNDATPPAAVSGLPELFQDGQIYTPDDISHVGSGGTVEIKLAVEAVDSPADSQQITGAATGQKIGLYLDLTVIKSQLDSAGILLDETKLTDLNGNLITITFELPTSMQGKTVSAIYRTHDDGSGKQVHTLTTTSSPEYFEQDGNIIALHVSKFSTYGIAYTPTSPPDPPIPPTSPPSGGSSVGGHSSSATETTRWVDTSDMQALTKSAAEQDAASVLTRNSGVTGIRKKALQLLAQSDLSYRHDTVANNTVQVRVYVDDPAAATKDILVSGCTTGNAVDKTAAIVSKWFDNSFAVISLDQQGDFGMKTRIAARVDLSRMNTSNLYFYSYDKATNKYKLFVTEYRIDSKGYLHFSTVLAGSIIITDKPLTQSDAEVSDLGQSLPDGGLNNPTTGGDGNGMFIPPAKAAPQDFAIADSIIEAEKLDGVLKLENKRTAAAVTGKTAEKSGGVLQINLDVPNITDAPQTNGRPNFGMMTGFIIAMFFTGMMLWAFIPRKSDTLVQKGNKR